MPSRTTARGLLGHFPYNADPPASNQGASPPPVRLPISLSLLAKWAAGAGRGGAQGRVGGRKNPRYGGGGG